MSAQYGSPTARPPPLAVRPQRQFNNNSLANLNSVLGVCGCCIILIALILLIIAAALPQWLTGTITRTLQGQSAAVSFNRKYGLYQGCGTLGANNVADTSCENIQTLLGDECSEAQSVFAAMEALMIIAIIFAAFTLCAFACGFYFTTAFGPWCGVLSLLLSFVSALIVIILFAALPYNYVYSCSGSGVVGSTNTELCPGCKLDVSYWLTVAAVILLGLALCLACCLAFRLGRRTYTGPSTLYAPISPVRPITPTSPTAPYGRYSPVSPPARIYSPVPSPPIPPLEDPLLARCEVVKDKLRNTLAQDAQRTLLVRSTSPAYIGPVYNYYH